MKRILLGVGLALGAIGSAHACGATDFAIKDFAVDIERCSGSRCPKLRLAGKLVNQCSAPAAARIEIQGLDGNGRPLANAEGWPASTRNLAPGEEVVFDFGPLMKFDTRLVDFKVMVVEVKSW